MNIISGFSAAGIWPLDPSKGLEKLRKASITYEQAEYPAANGN